MPTTGGANIAAKTGSASRPDPDEGPRIAICPEPVQWAVDAVVKGGGLPVDPECTPQGVVCTQITGKHVDELRGMLLASPNVQWVQLPMAGVDRAFGAGLIDRDRLWTSAKGAYADPVAEHALVLALAGLRHLPEWIRASSWGSPAGTSLFDQRVTVVGGGGVTKSLLRLLEPFRTEVTVVRLRPIPVAGAARTVGLDQLHAALGEALVVVLALALTPQSRRIIGRPELAAMRPEAWLINVARGGLIDTDALVDALDSAMIGGAALDVTDPEPLPAEHPLWRIGNCIISPHTADTQEMIEPLLAHRISENVRRFANGEELVGLVDFDLGY